MNHDLGATAPGDALVVNEAARVVHFQWGFLTGITLLGLLALDLFVDTSTENRVVVNVIGVLGAAIFLARWIYETRHPARLEISHDLIAQKRRGRRGRSVVINRTTGELTIAVKTARTGRYASAVPYLTIPDSDVGIVLTTYEQPKVKAACEAVGWQFVPRS